ncbi:serine carboxypeptidase-like enzyme [Selaginella moellendorffii]|uniref:Carboxypeptidase n=1 Tax=Selaginella moellendorffii TaxID=88036 RepID=D8QWK4_SELML|nr:serine carboxypeptidase-like enzyme [Selaginella moellendorffii]
MAAQSSLLAASTIAILAISLSLAADPSQLVTKLPGQPQVGFKHYAGNIPIKSGKALFYWFFEADTTSNAPSSLPLVLWLNGGPGCSSVGSGALGELGPFRPSQNGLKLNAYSWNKNANIIFLESPAGVGFSYSNSSDDSYTDDNTADQNLQFLIEWLKIFPEYSKNDFYVTGESYAGHYIPTLASKILSYNSQGGSINFKGIAIGNAWTDSKFELPGNVEFLHTHSIISDDIYSEAMENCFSPKGDAAKCSAANQGINRLTQFINPYNVYRDDCTIQVRNRRRDVDLHKNLLRRVYDTCEDWIGSFLNSHDVQEALHVARRPVDWSMCSDTINFGYSRSDFDGSMLPVYKKLLTSGIRIWIYSGDWDSVVSTLSSRSWIDALNLTVHTPWYTWDYEDEVGGWTQVYEGLTFATIRGAGHMVPTDRPGPALAMFQSFLAGKPLPTF